MKDQKNSQKVNNLRKELTSIRSKFSDLLCKKPSLKTRVRLFRWLFNNRYKRFILYNKKSYCA